MKTRTICKEGENKIISEQEITYAIGPSSEEERKDRVDDEEEVVGVSAGAKDGGIKNYQIQNQNNDTEDDTE